MSGTKRKVARNALKKVASKLVAAARGKKGDYIVRIHVANLHSVAVLRVTATSRRAAVEATKEAIEITGEVAPPETINERLKDMFDESNVDAGSDAVESVEETAAPEETPVSEPEAE